MPRLASQNRSARLSRRAWLTSSALWVWAGFSAGCIRGGPQTGKLDAIWGRRGLGEGKLQKPRAIAIDQDDLLYVVDVTPRIQVFDGDGNYIRGWQPPEFVNGKPSGLSFDREGNLRVADTHYFRVLTYTPAGKLLDDQTLGGECGHGPGQFNFVTDCAQDSKGNLFVAEYGEYDRIQKFTPDHRYLLEWGAHGNALGEFLRPQKLFIDPADRIWVTDACNHRVQVFDARGDQAQLLFHWGQQGREPGQLNYPYDILLDGEGHVYLCEFGNHRVQKFTLDGQYVGHFGANGRREGELDQPWGIARDSRGRMFVLDSYNHRIQRFWL